MASLPLVMLLVSLVVGGGPRFEMADDALLTLAMRDATRRGALVGPYSRFGWHHPGPAYLYLGGVPTRLWGGGPTGSWIGAVVLALACAALLAVIVRRAAGPRAGWWTAVGVLLVVSGLGPGLFRDPWNPYVVVLPVLFTAVACALAVAGARSALVWAAVVGSFAVQTHVSCAPVVGGLLAVACSAQVVRWRRRRQGLPVASDDIPGPLPALATPGTVTRWWLRRPEEAMGVAVLVAVWLPPLWDELFGAHNLTSIWDFFTSSHGSTGWEAAWREVTAVFGVVMFQHHSAVHDRVADQHVLLTSAAFVALVAAAVIIGVRRRRPAAVWLGAFGGVGALLAVYSVTRVVGEPFRYLVLWMAVLPAVPALGVVVGVHDISPPRWLRSAVPVAVLLSSLVAVRAVMQAPPAAAYSSQETARAWALLEPMVRGGHDQVRLAINDGSRWPVASGLALELERRGHDAHVAKMWTLLFGEHRLATGREPVVVYVTNNDPASWPLPTAATRLGPTGRGWLFVARAGPACWWGWLPLGGPACPVR
ncbi:MAG: hypothetical protein ACYDH6_03595 [Acidimicrobiales bacterium]